MRLGSAFESTVGARSSSPPASRTPDTRPSSAAIRSTSAPSTTSAPASRAASCRCAVTCPIPPRTNPQLVPPSALAACSWSSAYAVPGVEGPPACWRSSPSRALRTHARIETAARGSRAPTSRTASPRPGPSPARGGRPPRAPGRRPGRAIRVRPGAGGRTRGRAVRRRRSFRRRRRRTPRRLDGRSAPARAPSRRGDRAAAAAPRPGTRSASAPPPAPRVRGHAARSRARSPGAGG